MKTRERVGADIPNRFDYQLALSMSYLIDSAEPITIILETLEDFAIVKNVNNNEVVEIYQVKSVGSGLLSKTTLLNEDVYGKLFLTDKYFEKDAYTLNIISNANLKGNETEKLDRFRIFDRFTKKEKDQIYENIEKYFKANKVPYDKKEINSNKLIFIKTNLPLKDTLYEKTLIGSVNELLCKNLFDQSINPAVVFQTLKDYFIKVRNTSIEKELSFEDAKKIRGISSDVLELLLERVKESQCISKSELVSCCGSFLPAPEVLKVKNEYSNFIARSNDISDTIFTQFKTKMLKDFQSFIEDNNQLSTTEAIKSFTSQYKDVTYSKEFIIVCLLSYLYN